MFDAFFDDGLNPRFVQHAPVFFDELDAAGTLPVERLAAHVASAVDACHARSGQADELNVVRDIHIEPLHPVTSAGNLRVDVWLEELGTTTCTYGFLCSSEDGTVAYARGERTIVKLDPQLLRPASWSDAFFQKQSSILRGLHNA